MLSISCLFVSTTSTESCHKNNMLGSKMDFIQTCTQQDQSTSIILKRMLSLHLIAECYFQMLHYTPFTIKCGTCIIAFIHHHKKVICDLLWRNREQVIVLDQNSLHCWFLLNDKQLVAPRLVPCSSEQVTYRNMIKLWRFIFQTAHPFPRSKLFIQDKCETVFLRNNDNTGH